MACYHGYTVYYRGRLVYVETRYGCFNYAKVRKGKPLTFTEYEPHDATTRKLLRLFRRVIGKEVCNSCGC